MPVCILTEFLCYLYPLIIDKDFAIRELIVEPAIVMLNDSDSDNDNFSIERIRRRRKIEYLR